MQRKIIYIVLVIVVLIVIGFFVGRYVIEFQRERQKEAILSEIEDANYCETKADCAQAHSKCPFGCYVFVNNSEVDRIQSLIDSYESNCVYGCIQLEDYDCINNRCEMF